MFNISHEKTWTWQRKGNFKRETCPLLIAAQNNSIRTNHINARIDKTQQNSKCRLCGDKNETLKHIVSEHNKLAQKVYKTRHDWVGKVINWEMYKKLKFDHTRKWYIHNPASVLENDAQKTKSYNNQPKNRTLCVRERERERERKREREKERDVLY